MEPTPASVGPQRSAVLARVLVDASGDADIAARAGARLMVGRETDNKMRPMTLLFRLGGIDVERLLAYVRDNPAEFSRDPNQMMLDLESAEFSATSWRLVTCAHAHRATAR